MIAVNPEAENSEEKKKPMLDYFDNLFVVDLAYTTVQIYIIQPSTPHPSVHTMNRGVRLP